MNDVDKKYPIGSIYWSSKPTNPSSLFGGIWTRIKDTFIFASGDNDTVAQIPNGHYTKEYGNKTVTLNMTQIPSHNHGGTTGSSEVSVYFQFGQNPGKNGNRNDYICSASDNYYNGSANVIWNSTRHGHDINADGGLNGQTQPIDKMPPSLCKYCWERTA